MSNNQYTFWYKTLLIVWILGRLNMAISQDLNDIHLEMLDEEDGLSSHWITDINLDSIGYLWVGTYDGLNRYDGYGFKIFKHSEKDSTTLLHDYGQKMYVAVNGDVWISYSEGGISLFNREGQCFTHYKSLKINKELLSDKDFAIRYIDKETNIWYSGEGLGLNMFNPKQNKITQYDLPFLNKTKNEKDPRNLNTIYYIYPDENEGLWLCSQNGLYHFDKKSKKFDYIPSPTFPYGFHKLIPDGNQGFWLSSWSSGICYFHLKTQAFTYFPLGEEDKGKFGYYNLLDDFAIRDPKTFWVVSSDKGLGTLNKETGTYEFQTPSKTQSQQHLIFPHKILPLSNQAFFLIDENALMKYNPYTKIFNFKPLAIAESQHGDLFAIRKIIENPQLNEVYFATDVGNGLNILNTKTQTLKALHVDINPSRDKRMRVLDLITDKEGKMWLLSRDYLYEFDYLQQKLIKIEHPFELVVNGAELNEKKENEATFKYFVQDYENHIWVLTTEGEIYPFSPQKTKLLPKLNQERNGQKTIKNIYTTTFDKKNNLWVQGDQSLAYYKKEQLYLPMANIQQPTANCTFINDPQVLQWLKGDIKGMKTDTSGNIWIGISGKGLLKVDCQDMAHLKYHLYSTEDGLPTNNFNVINTDFMGNVWISTLMGVVCINAQTLHTKIFNQSVGMDKYTMGIRFLRGNNQQFYIASPGKYCKVNYQEINRYIPPPKTYIASFKVLNVEKKISLEGTKELILSPQENIFSFDFSCIDFTNQSHHEFAYMLEGWDKDWISAGKRRYVSYTNLDGGHYTFKVKGKNGEGIWGNTVSIPIFIETPFYKKTAFFLLCLAIFVVTVYAIYTYQIKQIEKTEKLKTEFNKKMAETRMQALRAQMNPHFIFNCLNSINRYIIKSDIKTSSLYLTRFAKLIRLILDNSQYKTIILSNELDALKLYIELEAFRFEKKFEHEIIVDENIDTDSIEIPPLLFQPYIENAIWHGLLHKDTQGNLSVHLSQTDDILTCKITDNGIGRAKAMEFKSKTATTRKSLGIKLTEERLNIAGEDSSRAGTQQIIDLYDEQGNPCGTQVIISLYI